MCLGIRGDMGSIPDGVFAILNLKYSLRPHYGARFDWSSERNEYQEYFLEGKGGRCVGLINLPPSCADCNEIWEHKPTEPSGTVQACTGIALQRVLKATSHAIATHCHISVAG
jgi:hypothetical protein